MPFVLLFTDEASGQLHDLEFHKSRRDLAKLAKVRKCLGLIETDPRYPGLRSHKYIGLKGKNGEDVWESYVENNISSAWRIFWHYGPDKTVVTIIAITPHP